VRRSALRLSIVEGSLHATMLGAGESFFGALAVELGHRDVELSLLMTLPLLVGAIAQFASPWGVRVLGSDKRWVVSGVVFQALTHLGLVAIALTTNTSFPLLLGVMLLYYTSGAAIVPAWNTWMTRLVPRASRNRYFASRSVYVQLALLVSFLAAGYVLEWFRAANTVMLGFAVLGAIALFSRLGGAGSLIAQGDVQHGTVLSGRSSLLEVIRSARWRVAWFAAILMFGSQLAIPFFTPYMLEDLELDYARFAQLSAVAVLAKALSFPVWQRLVERMPPLVVLGLTGALIAIVPTLWVVFLSFETLILAQCLSGVAWAGFELISLQLLMGDAPRRDPVIFWSLSSALSGLLQVTGAVLGGLALRSGLVDYHDIFLWSGLGRGAALLLLVPLASEQLRRVVLPLRARAVRVTGGAIREPIVSEPPPDDGRD
jgi:MFS family permease